MKHKNLLILLSFVSSCCLSAPLIPAGTKIPPICHLAPGMEQGNLIANARTMHRRASKLMRRLLDASLARPVYVDPKLGGEIAAVDVDYRNTWGAQSRAPLARKLQVCLDQASDLKAFAASGLRSALADYREDARSCSKVLGGLPYTTYEAPQFDDPHLIHEHDFECAKTAARSEH